jgi:hypothetical protein
MKFPITSSLTGLVMVNYCLGNNLRPNEMNQLNDFNNQSMGNDAKEESMARELIAGGVPVDTPRKYKVSTRSAFLPLAKTINRVLKCRR